MDTEKIIFFIIFAIIIIFNAINSARKKNGQDETPKRPIRIPRNTRNENDYGEENFEAAKKLIEEIKSRKTEYLENFDNDFSKEWNTQDVQAKKIDEKRRIPKKIRPQNSQYSEPKVASAYDILEDKVSKAAASLEESERILNEAMSKSNANAYLQNKPDCYDFDNLSNPINILKADSKANPKKRKFLREAFIMSEILSKPVSLRNKIGY